ncbi:toxin-antitoxin system YwqK family antitoxin [Variovorax atrisoli]|uniref:toxin-antitoxin system YwqK family antitoxin n=1 Tax=Variovorax atrisoli TaxID=3394203 RepID=UPI0033931E49
MQTSRTLIRILLATSGVVLFLSGCAESIDARQTQVVNGLIYKRNADDPFTGTLKNYPGLRLVPGCAEWAEVSVKDGLLDGKATCTTRGKKSAELGFKEGRKHGEWRTFDEKGEVYARVGWSNDRKDGVEKIDGPNYLNPPEPLVDLVWKNGKQTGTVSDYDAYTVFRYRDGQREGEQLRYWMNDGATLYLHRRENYAEGSLNGLTKILNPQGQVIREEIYKNGNLVSSKEVGQAKPPQAQPNASVLNVQGCVDTRIVAFRVQHGEDEVITADQLGEWESECRSGKRPG